LVGVGFENIVIGPEQIPHPEANFRVEATKPLTSIKNVPRVNRESLRSQEPMTYKEIFEDNSYGLSEEDIKSKTVIDVGANLGMFSLRCVELGVDKVVCIEAQKQVYYGGLLPNIREYYDIIKPMFGAVLDVDGKEVKIMNAHVASRVTNGEGDPTTTLTLETILKANALDNRNDLVLKLDCEGSEYPIVLNGNIETFRKFETIFMELHDNVNEDERYRNSQIVRDKLVEFGFKNVFINEMLWFEYNENGIPVKQQTIGVYVEKWIRN
jgi:FkbM family methyltransferase